VGLKWPTDILVEMVTQTYLVFQCLIYAEYERKFLAVSNQKVVLMRLCLERLNRCGTLVGECTCCKPVSELCKMGLSTLANIFLNNYSKRSADKRAKTKDSSK